MKQFYIFGIVTMILLPLLGKGTHLIGAEITANAESCQSNTYTVTFSLYEYAGSDVEFGSSVVNLGFGQPIEVGNSQDFFTQEISEDSMLRIRKLVVNELSFPGPGEYLVSYREFSRNADVVNIRQSVNTPFYVESKLTIDPLLCNSTPQLSESVNYLAYTGSTFIQELQASDPDGDSLSLEVVVPGQDADEAVAYLGSPLDIDLRYAENPTNAVGSGTPTLTVDAEALVWDAPNLPGEFTLALRINEWREIDGAWQQLGYVTRDLTVQVLDTVNGTAHTDIITATGDEVGKPKVQLYPNPTQGDFTLEVNDDTWLGASAHIHNIIGQEMDQRTVILGENAYHIPEYQQGVYFLTLQQGELQKVLRFVKR